MIKMLKADWKRNERKFPVILVLFLYRLGNYLYYSNINANIKKIIMVPIKILYKLIMLIFQCDIPFAVKIGEGIRIRHLNGIIINDNTIIGSDCTLFHQVTIGSNEQKKINGGAILGNKVYIGCGSKIIGNVTIGNNVNIGANSVLTKNVENNSTVIGCNKIIKHEYIL